MYLHHRCKQNERGKKLFASLLFAGVAIDRANAQDNSGRIQKKYFLFYKII